MISLIALAKVGYADDDDVDTIEKAVRVICGEIDVIASLALPNTEFVMEGAVDEDDENVKAAVL